MTEPETPIEKKRDKIFNKGRDVLPPPEKPPQIQKPQPTPKLESIPNKFTCQICGRTFIRKEELNLHTETNHQNPKKIKSWR